MKVISIVEHDFVNSITGVTMSIFFSGCSHKCKGCFNKCSWDYDSGELTTVDKLFDMIKNSMHKNVSLLGGSPFYIHNKDEVIKLIKRIKKELPNKIVYVWTGYTFEEVKEFIDVELIDYLITNKFVEELYNPNLILRGSSNQRIYNKGELYNTGGK